MVKITGLVRRCSALLIILIVCTGTNVAYPSTGRNDLLDRKDLLSLGPDKLEGIYQYKLDKGMKNLSVLSAFLIRNSNVFLQQGEIERASEYAEYAQLLSPVEIQFEPHVEFKQRIPHAIGLIRTGDTTQYGNIVLESA